MKCVLPGNNVKVFGRAIHCLSKIGEDLYIEPLDNGLALRTVNSSRSAYACSLFAPTFFMQYHANTTIKNNSPDLDDDDDPFRCRISMKSCLSVFKSLSSLEKTVDKCRISLDTKECRLVFQMHCKHGIVKTYNLTYQETETLQAVFSKDLCPNHIVADAKELCDVVTNFQTSQEEITLSVNPQQVSFKNYVDDEPDPSKVLHSEMFLSPEEFEDYTIGVDTEVTFCLKELRAILAFADGAGLPVSLHFETTGKPIVFNINGEQNVLEATFVLATLADTPASQVSCTQLSTQHSRTQTRINTSTKHRRTKQQPPSQRQQLMTPQNNRQPHLHRLPNGHGQEDRPSTSRVESVSVGDTTAMDVEFPDDVMLAAGDAAMERLSQQENREQQENDEGDNTDEPDRTLQGDISPSPVIPVVTSNIRPPVSRPSLRLSPTEQEETTKDNAPDDTPSKLNSTLLANFENDDDDDREKGGKAQGNISIAQDLDEPSDNDDDYDFIPGTPPSKKFKSMFFGASQSQSTQRSEDTRRKQNVTVLAEDTDDEDSD
ncbi:cell cycle checkpoint control protein RAD9B-like [Amphiura filiformis]|uniref:cell cycle checkpoint control protein RAD9B-like n=1 Tax=Amphiura filiformis TaxID=82378 RepID=UPI003B2108FF